MNDARPPTFRERMGRIEGLIQALEDVPDLAVQNDVRALVQELLQLHTDGLARLCERAYEAAGQPLIDAVAQDEEVGNLLLLHGLHPLPIETRVLKALDSVRPYLGSHGGDVELLGVTPEGAVRLRLEGSCDGCPSSRATLRYTIEEAVYEAAPDATALEVAGTAEAPAPPLLDGFMPISEMAEPNGYANGHAWEEVTGLASLEDGALRAVNVSGRPVVFCRVEGRLYAYARACPHCEQSLDAATLEGPTLTCPACGHRYDVVRAGRGLDTPALHLTPFPLLTADGRVRVKVWEAVP